MHPSFSILKNEEGVSNVNSLVEKRHSISDLSKKF